MKSDVKSYDLVFVLDMLPYVDDGVRSETHDEAVIVHDLLVKVYEVAGYKVIRMPAVSVEERVEFVLDFLNELKKKEN